MPLISSATLRSLGVTLDRQLSFDQHVTDTCRKCYFHIRAFRHVRNSLPDDVAKSVACGIVGSRLDYCNSLLFGISAANIDRLQKVQNTLARVTLRQSRATSSVNALAELHWLPINYRINFKIATLTYMVKHCGYPTYLRELLHDYKPTVCLRSSFRDLLLPARVRTVLASRGFSQSSSTVWNNLPDDIRACSTLSTFKRRLKTHFYNVAFN